MPVLIALSAIQVCISGVTLAYLYRGSRKTLSEVRRYTAAVQGKTEEVKKSTKETLAKIIDIL